ncbi:MAG: hypothetical protein KGH96_23790, partial [Sphingomonadales bacterium]|nr:hypothetical protein [Sphingomonadales bacterium]
LWLARCRHDEEIVDRDEMGVQFLRCYRCHRRRPYIIAGARPAYHRTQEVTPPTAAELARQEHAAFERELAAMMREGRR